MVRERIVGVWLIRVFYRLLHLIIARCAGIFMMSKILPLAIQRTSAVTFNFYNLCLHLAADVDLLGDVGCRYRSVMRTIVSNCC